MSLEFHQHPDTAELVETLRKVPIGGRITYSDLTAAIGVDVTGPARARLSSARKIALRDHGAAFATEHGVGLTRIPPEDAHTIGAQGRGKVRRAARRAITAMTHLAQSSNGLSPAAQRRLSAELSTHGLIAHLSLEKATDAVVAAHDAKAPPAKVAETFLAFLRGDKPTAAPEGDTPTSERTQP